MTWKRVASLLLACCVLQGLLPVYIVARGSVEVPRAFTQKEHPLESAVLPAAVDLEVATAQNNVRPGRIAHVFPDPALAQVIAEAFGVTVQNFVIQADLNRILALVADGREIQNLEGMQYLHALGDLSLNDNRIRDLHPLSGLYSLERLLLDDNQIQDLSPLAGLTNLDWLWLDHNQVQDLRPLERLVELRWLTLWGNRVQDVAPLHRMVHLESLWLADNQIGSISPLAGLENLRILSLASNRIADLTPLAAMGQMQLLWLGQQEILLPQAMRQDLFEKPNAVRDVNGVPIPPINISDQGTYTAPTLRWTGLTTDTERVSYSFDQNVALGFATDRFHGTVIQPLAATPFVDVRRGDWFYDAVDFVFAEGLMSGTSPTLFSPEEELNRAMVATVLHRMAGAPAVGYQSVFEDVPAGTWYTRAAIWAYEAGIVRGFGRPEVFAPYEPITREQFATMLHRYAQSKGEAGGVPPDFRLDNFTDQDEISAWAYEAMAWSVANSLIQGVTPTILLPQDTANRAVCAIIVMRYLQRVVIPM